MPEFGSHNLETLRQPLEDRVITISRASGSLTFPANFVLVAALNPYPCGYFGDDRNECTCSMSMVQRYQKRISGPLMDRIDIHLDVQRVPYQKLEAAGTEERSKVIRDRVAAVQQMNLSARAYHRVLKLAGGLLGAIADLAGEKMIQPAHLGEALQYRPREIV